MTLTQCVELSEEPCLLNLSCEGEDILASTYLVAFSIDNSESSSINEDLQVLPSRLPYENCWPPLACDLGHCHARVCLPHLVSRVLLATERNQGMLAHQRMGTTPLQDPGCSQSD